MEHPVESCRDVLALLSDYVDFELPLTDCGEVERHLADCPACHEFVERLRDTIDRARSELESAWRNMLAAPK